MDHDNEITTLPDEGSLSKVQLFLKDNLRALRQEEQKFYNLEQEFAKTAKNRDYFSVRVISAVAVVIVLVAGLVTWRISEASKNVAVDITVFEDLNLKNVLDLAKKAEVRLDSLNQEKSALSARFRVELDNLTSQKQSELDILAVQRLATAERNRRIRAVEQSFAAKEQNLRSLYDPQFAAIDTEIAEVSKQVESFDSRRIEQAREQQKILDTERSLFELEKNQMKNAYESEITNLRERMDVIQKENSRLKTTQIRELVDQYQGRIDELDPVLVDEQASEVIEMASLYGDTPQPFAQIPESVSDETIFSPDILVELGYGYSGLTRLLEKVSTIPFDNEASVYVQTARKIAFLTGYASEQMIRSAIDRIGSLQSDIEAQKKNLAETKTALEGIKGDLAVASDKIAGLEKENGDYQALLSASAALNKYDGYVTALNSPEEPVLFLTEEARNTIMETEGPLVYVYRAPKTLVATFNVLKNEDGTLTPVLKKMERNREIYTLDYVSVKKR